MCFQLLNLPQGSVLGPLLFLLFVNDLPEGIRSILKLYADDVKMIVDPKNFSNISLDLELLELWEAQWCLKFNVQKCMVMQIGLSNPKNQYSFGGESLRCVDNEKDLGVTFNSSFSFEDQMIKSAIGAVFNVSLCLGEIILGIPPITITNKLNSIKHLLKINISQIPDDPLRDMISQHLMESNVRTFNRVKEAFLFLQWKLIKTPEDFSNTDTTIVSSGDIQGFSYLSDSSCSYTKTQIQHYTEELWQKSVNNQYCMDGHQYYPKVQCSKIRFPTGTTRETETLTLSLFYPNNLLNSFLYRFNKDRFITPLCGCGEGEQDATHVLTQCKMVKAVTKRKLVSLITEDFPIDILRPFFS